MVLAKTNRATGPVAILQDLTPFFTRPDPVFYGPNGSGREARLQGFISGLSAGWRTPVGGVSVSIPSLETGLQIGTVAAGVAYNFHLGNVCR